MGRELTMASLFTLISGTDQISRRILTKTKKKGNTEGFSTMDMRKSGWIRDDSISCEFATASRTWRVTRKPTTIYHFVEHLPLVHDVSVCERFKSRH